MKPIGKRVLATWPVLILAAVTMMAFQNCSQAQFGDGSLDGGAVLSSVDGDESGSTSGSTSSQVDLITPRIVLSDRMNGPAKFSFSPSSTVYGTVYGLGPSNVHVCIGHDNYCLSHPKDIWNYNVNVNKLPNWAYNPVDKTWRFQVSYANIGDSVNKISVRDLNRKSDSGVDGAQIHIENFIRIVSQPQEAKIYFARNFNMLLFTQDPTVPGNVFDFNQARMIKIAGLGKDDVYVCGEVAGSNRCQTEGNWVRSDQKHLRWSEEGNFIVGSPFDITAGGTYNYYAKSAITGATAGGTITVKDKQIVCSMRSSTAVFGPCSDPESSNACSQSTVGQTVQGTGSCRVSYTCRCD